MRVTSTLFRYIVTSVLFSVVMTALGMALLPQHFGPKSLKATLNRVIERSQNPLLDAPDLAAQFELLSSAIVSESSQIVVDGTAGGFVDPADLEHIRNMAVSDEIKLEILKNYLEQGHLPDLGMRHINREPASLPSTATPTPERGASVEDLDQLDPELARVHQHNRGMFRHVKSLTDSIQRRPQPDSASSHTAEAGAEAR